MKQILKARCLIDWQEFLASISKNLKIIALSKSLYISLVVIVNAGAFLWITGKSVNKSMAYPVDKVVDNRWIQTGQHLDNFRPVDKSAGYPHTIHRLSTGLSTDVAWHLIGLG